MFDFFRDTVFGRLVQVASRGHLFSWEEQKDPLKLQGYHITEPPSSSETSIDTSINNHGDPEKGKDVQLVDWAANDPEVYLLHLCDSRTWN
jgi:hypothetical protein